MDNARIPVCLLAWVSLGSHANNEKVKVHLLGMALAKVITRTTIGVTNETSNCIFNVYNRNLGFCSNKSERPCPKQWNICSIPCTFFAELNKIG